MAHHRNQLVLGSVEFNGRGDVVKHDHRSNLLAVGSQECGGDRDFDVAPRIENNHLKMGRLPRAERMLEMGTNTGVILDSRSHGFAKQSCMESQYLVCLDAGHMSGLFVPMRNH